jgi:hypothetical protein
METSQIDKQQNKRGKQKIVSHWSKFKQWIFQIGPSNALMVSFTGVIATATVIYTIYAQKQWRIASDALIAAERAWVLYDSIDLKRSVITPDLKVGIYQVIFRNVGRGPANEVTVCAEAASAIPPSQSFDCTIHTDIVAAPGGDVGITVPGPAFPDVAKQIFIWGRVKYRDQFQIIRYTDFCGTVLLKPSGQVASGHCHYNKAY